jgi:hypothetical protein
LRPSGFEAETRVVFGVTQNHHRRHAALVAAIQARAHQTAADTVALVFGQHHHGRQTHPTRLIGNGDWAEENMPHRITVAFGHQTDQIVASCLKGFHQIGLGGAVEGGFLDLANGSAITIDLVADVEHVRAPEPSS